MAFRPHFSNGKPCDCTMTPGDDLAAYAAAHPNKKKEDGTTFNDEIAAAIQKSTRERLSS